MSYSLSIETKREGSYNLLVVCGAVDSIKYEEFETAMQACTRKKFNLVLSGVPYISGRGLMVIKSLAGLYLKKYSTKLVVIGLCKCMQDILELDYSDLKMEFFPSMSDFWKMVQKQKKAEHTLQLTKMFRQFYSEE